MNSEEHQLSRKYMESFFSKYKLAARIMIICQKVILYLVIIQVFIFTIIAYFDSEMNFSLIIMSTWFVVIIISLYYLNTLFMATCTYVFMVSLYIRYRFRQVQDLIEIYLKRGNIFQIIKIIDISHIYPFCEKKLNI